MSDLNVALIIAAIDQATAPLCKLAGGFRRLGEGIRRSAGQIRRALGNAQVAAVLNYTLIKYNITA